MATAIKLRCTETGEEFLVVTEYAYGNTVYRAISTTGYYLSEAVGETVDELIVEINGIEEVDVKRVIEN